MVDPLVAGIIGIVLLFVFLFSGMPVSIGLGLSGLIGIFLISGGVTGMFLGMGTVASDQLWHGWGLLAIPMFIFMGNILAGY